MSKKNKGSSKLKIGLVIAAILVVALALIAYSHLSQGISPGPSPTPTPTPSPSLTVTITPFTINAAPNTGAVVTVTVTNGASPYTVHGVLNGVGLGVITETTDTFTLSLPAWTVGTYTFLVTLTDSAGALVTSNTITILVS